ncbi:hypothetical protein FOZ61_009527 [Perkinsus olseni]|uniref:Uncharacterized protein n=1 Tax=Perkinsus olseni TaxID=32597 RepID=A0A7J6MGR7_PEROL|nr:hypothetical protein FOZ61_009527 [Perkinsus olseni]KAF4676130.1 hypothetical protein FOL46_007183 [Perkinsus olseni]KAF4759289.1 hypothetical protein FOZ63_028215 [Perkinsus olseni]
MFEFLDSFWKWLFKGASLDYFVQSSDYRDGWWQNVITTYAGWALGFESILMFGGLIMFAVFCGARHATFMTMILIFLFVLAGIMLFDNMMPQLWAMFKGLIRDKLGIFGKLLVGSD